MGYTIQLDRVYFQRNELEDTAGAALYLILSPCPDNPCNHVCRSHPRMVHHYELQRFRLGSFGHRKNASAQEIAENKANVWGWDGNREQPTLRASFLGQERDDKGKQIRPYRVHLFLTAGKIELCGDSTVTLHPNPLPCTHDD